MNVTDSARDFLLMEGTDIRYGARPLKRAIERLLVQPISNLIVTGQIRQSDCYPRDSHSIGAAPHILPRGGSVPILASRSSCCIAEHILSELHDKMRLAPGTGSL